MYAGHRNSGEDDRHRHYHHVDGNFIVVGHNAVGTVQRRKAGGQQRRSRARQSAGDVRRCTNEVCFWHGLFDGVATLLRQVRQNPPDRLDHVPRIVSFRVSCTHIHRRRQADDGRKYLH